MRRRCLTLLSLAVVVMASGTRAQTASPAEPDSLPRPNILIIVADDLGYSDLSPFGGEIATPHIAKLAEDGVIVTGFRTAPAGSPTRAMLLCGVDHHLTGLGAEPDQLAPNQEGQPGYEGYLNFRVVTMATLLRGGGYHTYMAGRWGLGRELSQGPMARGFDRSFALLGTAASHLDQTGVTKKEKEARYLEDSTFVDLPPTFFSTEFYTDRLISYIDEHHGDGKPFFAYLAYTAPHWPLQAPDEYLDRYAGRYDGGYDSLRVARMARMVELGIIPDSLADYTPLPGHKRWEKLNADKRKMEARKMEIYAAMVENLDFHVGRLLDHLREIGQYENTVILFMSDGAADGSDPATDPDREKWIKKTFDNSLANLGRKGSMAARGPGWAVASMAPYQGYAGFTTEGGIRAPFIAVHHPVIPAEQQQGEFVSVLDIMPSVLDLARVSYPDVHGGRKTIPLQGATVGPFLRGEQDRVHPVDQSMGWELSGRRALRAGRWKVVWLEEPYGKGDWALYHLRNDPTETRDLADLHPEKVRELDSMWKQYASENGVILPEYPETDIEAWDSY